MEIKVGDKVRIADNVPEIYTQTIFSVHIPMDMEVEEVQDGSARITPILSGACGLSFEYIIPTKYLTKVNAEEKEPKFKAGEIVRYRYDGKLYIVECQTGEYYYALRLVGGDVMMHDVLESDLELVTEPKQEIKVGDMVIVKPDAPNMCKSVDVFKHIKSVVTKIENGKAALDIDRLGDGGLELFDVPLEYIQKVDAIEHLHNHGWGDLGEFTLMPMSANPIIGFEQSYWQRYEADLAKDIAVKITNKKMDNDPKEAANYAVSVAKAVVENLKKK